jgi:hypothetical protein
MREKIVAHHLYDRSKSHLTRLSYNSHSQLTLTTHTTMGQLERLVLMAEDELTQYSTDARKMEKLRQKIGLSVSRKEQEEVKAALLAEMPTDPLRNAIETQRQTVALPFWGIAGLGLLFGISAGQPIDFLATLVGGAIAYKIQQLGWQLQAKRLALRTLEDIEERMKNPAP